MSGRTPIERWSRGELEDRFHAVADTLSTLKQKNNRLEREVKMYKYSCILKLAIKNWQFKWPNWQQKLFVGKESGGSAKGARRIGRIASDQSADGAEGTDRH